MIFFSFAKRGKVGFLPHRLLLGSRLKNSAQLKSWARHLTNSRYAIVSKQHRLKPPPLHSTNLKKEKIFSFFRFKTTSHSSLHIGRMSASAMRPWGTWEGADKGVDHAKLIGRRNLNC
jgi:hypothetical protein